MIGGAFPSVRLQSRSLACARGGTIVVRDQSIALVGGDALILRGANGAGKTTLLRALAGLARIAGGTLEMQVGDTRELEDVRGRCVHYVGHLNALRGELTSLENLQFWAAFLGGAQIPAMQAFQSVGARFPADAPAARLSVGQRRRLALARLVLAPRAIWLLDEPTAGLDGAGTEMVRGLIEAHLACGGLAVIATHDPLDVTGAQVRELTPQGRAAA
ncbi:MAG: heme ABC exporter ATP-binding protein CcmA [Pseudomonadota bacterium]